MTEKKSKDSVLTSIRNASAVILAAAGLVWGAAHEIHRIGANENRSMENRIKIDKVADAIHKRNEKIDDKLSDILVQVTRNGLKKNS